MNGGTEHDRTAFSRFDSMTTEELEEILRRDAKNTDSEASGEELEMLFYVMGVLAAREDANGGGGRTAQEALASFREHYWKETEQL